MPALVLRNLTALSFDKRKVGAQEIEKILRRLKEQGNAGAIRRVLVRAAPFPELAKRPLRVMLCTPD